MQASLKHAVGVQECFDSRTIISLQDFDTRFAGWSYLYHGTRSKFIGPILSSGFRGSIGQIFCRDEPYVFMSPSIEYCGFPRYANIHYNPETRDYIQFVLQCRVRPTDISHVKRETVLADNYNLEIDPNIPNHAMEYLIQPNYTDPSGHRYVRGSIICTGIMVRATDRHPFYGEYWWTRDPRYLNSCPCLQQPVLV